MATWAWAALLILTISFAVRLWRNGVLAPIPWPILAAQAAFLLLVAGYTGYRFLT